MGQVKYRRDISKNYLWGVFNQVFGHHGVVEVRGGFQLPDGRLVKLHTSTKRLQGLRKFFIGGRDRVVDINKLHIMFWYHQPIDETTTRTHFQIPTLERIYVIPSECLAPSIELRHRHYMATPARNGERHVNWDKRVITFNENSCYENRWDFLKQRDPLDLLYGGRYGRVTIPERRIQVPHIPNETAEIDVEVTTEPGAGETVVVNVVNVE